eukprot:352726-Chlamydomonas_euryale.AAC.2
MYASRRISKGSSAPQPPPLLPPVASFLPESEAKTQHALQRPLLQPAARPATATLTCRPERPATASLTGRPERPSCCCPGVAPWPRPPASTSRQACHPQPAARRCRRASGRPPSSSARSDARSRCEPRHRWPPASPPRHTWPTCGRGRPESRRRASACRRQSRAAVSLVDPAKARADDGHHDGVDQALLDLHNAVHDKHAHEDARPRDRHDAVGHVEEPLNARNVRDEDLHAGRQEHGQEDDVVAREHARVERRHLDEARREAVPNLAEHEHVERLSARQCPLVHAQHQDNEDDAHKDATPQHELAEQALADAAWRLVHHAGLGRLNGERHAHRARGNHVHVQHLDGRQRRLLKPNHIAPPDGEALRKVDRQIENEQLAQVVPHAAALTNSNDDRREVVVGQHHLGRLLGHLRAGDTHGHAAVGRLERRRVVHAVARHGDNVARPRRHELVACLVAALRDARRLCRRLKHLARARELVGRAVVVLLVAVQRAKRAATLLQRLDDAQLVFRRRARKDVAVVDKLRARW